MRLITSPAKLMNISNKTKFLTPSTPQFIEDSALIQSYLKEKSPQFLSELMELSMKLADENWERNQNWKKNPNDDEATSALFAFTGEVYRGLDANTLDEDAVQYLQEHYRILSGLYGLLKPSDKVMLYRLEMGRKFQFEHYKNLYEFWSEKITEQLNSEVGEKDFILNLASNEYFKVVNKKQLKAKVIDFEFYEMKSGKPKTIVVYTKHARGLVVRFCAENQVKNLEEVKAFNYEGYILSDELSTENKLVFLR
ncbi:MAG: peroxide stress protein YaaA [Flavobacteriaceae bacterium]|nr:peroxide stress protein YaaA [Flavobacteriaceae bacterium]